MDDLRSEQEREIRLNSLVLVAIYAVIAVLGILAILFVAANLPTVIYWIIVILVALAVLMIVLSILSLFFAIPFFMTKGSEVKAGNYDMDDQDYPGEDRSQGRLR